MRIMKKYTLFFWMSLIWLSSSFANDGFAPYNHFLQFRNRVFYDYYFYRESDQDSLYQVQITYQLPINFLKFFRDDSLFTSRYEVSIVIYKNKKFVNDLFFEKTTQEKDYQQTYRSNVFCIDQVEFKMDSGEYDLKIRIVDANSKNDFENDFKMKLPPYRLDGESLSSFNLGFKPIGTLENPDILPNVSRTYNETQRQIFIVYRIFQKANFGEFDLTYQIQSLDNQKLHLEKKRSIVSGPDIGWMNVIDSMDISSLTNGKYSFSMGLKSNGNLVKREKYFFVNNSNINFSITYRDHIRLLGYIANHEELDKLKKASGSSAVEEQALEEFWSRRDPSPGTEENEEKEQFYSRVQFADENFAISRFKRGWETDMGRIFIILGQPDSIERYDYNLQDKPYQIWAYYKINRKFIFIDYTGFGDFELLPGTSNEYY